MFVEVLTLFGSMLVADKLMDGDGKKSGKSRHQLLRETGNRIRQLANEGMESARRFDRGQPLRRRTSIKKGVDSKGSESSASRTLKSSSGDRGLYEAHTHSEALRMSFIAAGVSTGGLIINSGVLLMAGLPVAIYLAEPMFRRSVRDIVVERKLSHDVASSAALTMLLGTQHFYLVVFGNWMYRMGNFVQAKVKGDSRQMMLELLEKKSDQVVVLRNGIEFEVPIAKLQRGEIVVINTGEMVGVDGTVIDGCALIDQHMLTGESQPVERGPGEAVFAGTMVLTNRVLVRVEKSGGETLSAEIEKILRNSVHHRPQLELKGQRWADQSASYFLGAFGLSLATLGIEPATIILLGNYGNKLRLLAPLGTLSYLKRASQINVLIKDGAVLESLKSIDTVVFDKTGTLTTNQQSVTRIECCNGYMESELLSIAATAEGRVQHPIAEAIVGEARRQGVAIATPASARYEIGYGIAVELDGDRLLVGSERYMNEQRIPLEPVNQLISQAHSLGHSIVLVARNGELVGAIELKPNIRPEVRQIIGSLRKQGIKQLSILSGDQENPTRQLAESLGMDSYHADVLPEQKSEVIRSLREQGRKVCFIGDGVNDCLAMQSADVAISLANASAIAIDSAQIVLLDGDLGRLAHLFSISHELSRNLRNSFALSLFPTAANLGGAVMSEGYAIADAFLIKQGAFVVGVGNAVLPSMRSANRDTIEGEVASSERSRHTASLPLLPATAS